MSDATIDHGSNISGVSLLLNVEKISSSVDIDDMERKVKNMYIEAESEDESEEEPEETDIVNEYEQAMEELQSELGEDAPATGMDTRSVEGGDEPADNDDAMSLASHRSMVSARMPMTLGSQYAAPSMHNMSSEIDKEIEDDRRNTMLENIESVKGDLQELGIGVDGPQYYVAFDAPMRRIEEVNRRLTFKYNKIKYNSIAEEALVAGASLLEMVFNGKHEYFGCRPDITGYSDVVKSKLKRIRVETSAAVGRFVAKNNIGVLPRLMMELLPSLITQSQRRKMQIGDSLNANMNYKKNSIRCHISDLNNM